MLLQNHLRSLTYSLAIGASIFILSCESGSSPEEKASSTSPQTTPITTVAPESQQSEPAENQSPASPSDISQYTFDSEVSMEENTGAHPTVGQAQILVFRVLNALPQLDNDTTPEYLKMLETKVITSFTDDAVLIMGNQRVPIKEYVRMARRNEAFIPMIATNRSEPLAVDTIQFPLMNSEASTLIVGYKYVTGGKYQDGRMYSTRSCRITGAIVK